MTVILPHRSHLASFGFILACWCAFTGCYGGTPGRLSPAGDAFVQNMGAVAAGTAIRESIKGQLNPDSQPVQVNVNSNNSNQSSPRGEPGFLVRDFEGTCGDGDHYKGTMDTVTNRWWGRGVYTCADGRKYDGEFKDGKQHGQGTFTWPDGTKYVGEWRDGKKHGRGVFIENGCKYEGEFRDDRFCGLGVLTFPDGASYNGEWLDSRPHGQSEYTFEDGRKRKGEYNHGRMDGEGTMTWPDGTKYTGQFIDSRIAGVGKKVYPDGRIEDGLWKDDKFVGAVQPVGAPAVPVAGDKPGVIALTCDVEDAEITVDGAFVGNAPSKLPLKAGTYKVSVRKAGYKPYEKDIRVDAGSELTLKVPLVKE